MVKSSCDTGNLNKPCLLRWKCLTTSRFSRRLIIILNLTQMEWLVSWVRLGVLDMRIKTKITASHTLNEKRNKQTKRKQQQQQQQQQHSPQELHGNTGIDWSHWEQFVLIFSKTADCIVQRAHAFFQSLPIHAQLCISKNRSFFLVFSRSLAHREKKKATSYCLLI